MASQFADRLNQMALIALIYARAPGSTLHLAKILSFTILPVFLVGPVACSYVDRWDRRRIMLSSEFLRALLVISIATLFIKSDSVWPVYIIVFLVFSINRFFVPAKMAIIPELVSREKFLLGNSLISISGMITAGVGFGLGGLIIERIGASNGFMIIALTYFISGLLILMISTKTAWHFPKEQAGQVAKSLFAEIKEGWQYLAQDKELRFVAQIFFLLGSAAGAASVVIIVFVQTAFGSVTQHLGILALFLGVGLFSASLIYGRLAQKLPRVKAIFIFLGASGVILSSFTICLGLFASTLFAAVFSCLLGMTLAPIIISAYTLIHEIAEQKMHGRIFGSLDIVGYLAFFLFMFLSSFLAEQIGQFWFLLLVGATVALIGLGALLLKIDRRKGASRWLNTT